MTEHEFVTDVRKRVKELYSKVPLVADCVGNTPQQTIAKVEYCAFIGILMSMLEKVK